MGALTPQRYKNLVPYSCRQFLGPEFALLGPEYTQLHPLLPFRSELSRLLVFFGGVDQDNFTGRSLQVLMDPLFSHLAVDVVLGIQALHSESVAELVSKRPLTTLHSPLPSLAGLIARADLAIGAGGTTTWERACLKLPSLIMPVASNQLDGAQALAEYSCSMLLSHGNFDASLSKAITQCLKIQTCFMQ